MQLVPVHEDKKSGICWGYPGLSIMLARTLYWSESCAVIKHAAEPEAAGWALRADTLSLGISLTLLIGECRYSAV